MTGTAASLDPDRPDPRATTALSVLCLVLAATLRVWQYLGNASLWLDEAELARNILQHQLPQLLTQPLLRDQVAPPGFLALERLVVSAWGGSEPALRLVPLIASLLSLPLFWRVSARVLDQPARSLARVLFAFGFALIWYGSQVKQYSTDVTIALAVTLLVLDLPQRRSIAPSLLLGLIAVWFSTTAILVLAGLSGALLLQPNDRPARGRLIGLLGAWAIGSAVAGAYAMHLVSPETQAAMHRHWREAFFPLPPWHAVDLVWPLVRLGSVFGASGLRYLWPALPLALAILGTVTLLRVRRGAMLVLLGPVAVTLLAAVLRLYPFSSRLEAFLMPAFLIALAAGIDTVGHSLRVRLQVPRGVTQVALLVPLVGPVLLAPPVWRPEELRPLVQELARHREPGDPVYVYHGAGTALQYYAEQMNHPLDDVVIGVDYRGDPRGYLRELDRYRGVARLWVVFSHDTDPDRRLILSYLAVIGAAGDSTVVPAHLPLRRSHGASLYRFDLSDGARLTAATAESFPVPAPVR
jgi:hypothetical protein